MKKARADLIIIDLIILWGAYIFMAWMKPVMVSYLSTRYLTGFGVTLILWLFSSFYFRKYHISKNEKVKFLFQKILYPNLVALAFVSFIIYAFNTTFYSRMMVFGTFGVATLLEMMIFSLFTYLIASQEYEAARAFIEAPPTATDRQKLDATITHSEIFNNPEALQNAVLEECGEKAATYIAQHVGYEDKKALITATQTRFNILRQPDNHFNTIVNLRRINDIRHLNRFFESINHKLPQHGRFIGCAETAEMRRKRILAKFPPVINWIVFFIDFIIKRVFPKFYPTRAIYFFLTRGNNRVLTRAEILGRLFACGFEVRDETYVNGRYFFNTQRIKEPAFDANPTYGPFISLRRVGKGGKLIRVYKFRTMYPYAEYLQDYVHKQNNLDNGGKFKNDFRVASSRAFMRKLWLDELPMILNLFKGDLKLVGVRPLSQHYFNLYSKELQEKRIKYRPGLIPPYYADLPESLEEIEASEMRYLESFEKRPLCTQWRYFWKAVFNILFRKARSS